MKSLCASLAVALTLILTSCGDAPSQFPPGLAPLAPDTAPEPTPVAGDKTPERLSTVSDSGGDYDEAFARGYIHAPIATVFAALQEPPTVIDRRNVDAFTITKNVEPGYEVSFRVHNVVHDIVTVTFDITWREGVVAGSKSAPQVVAARAAKTAGTSYISLLEVSVVLTAVSDSVTRVELVEQIQSATDSADTIEQYLKDLYASLLAKSHGHPLPTY